ncbi:hypothetical protein V5N11_033130 [Cardamine amara subsp. amara]|uniref:Integrase catalytic domain-containing protein n=1 Tax=Cardamine amara subsp. amara TaxID=228776 RepID=A0ABD1BLV8_CARAN
MTTDCEEFASKCYKCQRHSNIINSPIDLLTTGAAPYPFMRWAMDIVGPLPPSNHKKYLIFMTDYFTKWVEAEAYSSIHDDEVKKFIWNNIIYRHGVPYEIVTDNGSNLTSGQIEEICDKWRIRLCKSTPRYPQGNGQA